MEEFVSNDLLPHGYCLVWQPELVLLHLISDGLITLSYYSIPIALAYFVAARKDLAYNWMFRLFGAFIFACGTTHLMSIVTLWEPTYWLDGGVKAATAGISLVTATLLWPLIPKALALPSPHDLKRSNQELQQQIIERRQVEEALRQAKDELEQRVTERTAELSQQTAILQSIINNMGEGLVVADKKGKFLVFNPAAERLVGLGMIDGPPDEWSKTYGVWYPDTINMIPPQELPLVRAIQGEALDEVELFVRNPKKPEGIFISVNARPLKDETGVPKGGIVIFRDITQRKQAEQELRHLNEALIRSNKELEQFAYVASHDLQEPLRTVASYVQLFSKRYKGQLDEKADKYIGYIVDGAERMGELISDLLDYSRVDRREYTGKLTNCETVLKTTLDNLQGMIDESKAIISYDPLPGVLIEGSQLQQVFQNLISNAIKFRAQESPRIHLSAVQRDEEWLFSVTDNGIGIDSQYAERIFAIFQRLHSRREYPGTGIGLAICRKIIERYGGNLWVESELGKGATFYFTLPL